MKPMPWPALLAVDLLVAIVSGAALAFVAPPVNLHWLHWVVYVPMLVVLGAPRARLDVRGWLTHRHTWVALTYGVVAEAAIFWWISDTITSFSNIPQVLAIAILGLFALVFGAPYTLLWWLLPTIRRHFGAWWVLAFPAAMVVLEWLGTFIILFPYSQGVAQYRVLPTFQIVSVTGIWGATFLVLLVNAAIAEILLARRERRGVETGGMAGGQHIGSPVRHSVKAVPGALVIVPVIPVIEQVGAHAVVFEPVQGAQAGIAAAQSEGGEGGGAVGDAPPVVERVVGIAGTEIRTGEAMRDGGEQRGHFAPGGGGPAMGA
jgi:hypothetical protein